MVKEYAVGGFVRDRLRGQNSKDLDIVLVGPNSFEEMKTYVIEKGYTIYQERPEFLTIRANHTNHGAVDFALPRVDSESSDGRRPDSVEFTQDLAVDLSRRDFTMNAIAMDLETQEYIDPFNGAQDIDNQVIQFVGNAQERLQEDALRFFRALRFQVTLNFELSKATNEALYFSRWGYTANFKEFMRSVSSERVKDELVKMAKVSNKRMFSALSNFGLFDFLEERKINFLPTLKEVK